MAKKQHASQTRIDFADSDADLEPDPGDAAFRAHEVEAFDSCVRITFIHRRSRLVDPDGISVKAAIDGLVAVGLLTDDSAQQVKEIRHRQLKGKPETTTIIIEEVDEQQQETH